MPGVDEKLLVPVEEVARTLSISRRSVWKGVRAGSVPQPVKVLGRTLWRRAELEKWVARGCPAQKGV